MAMSMARSITKVFVTAIWPLGGPGKQPFYIYNEEFEK
jgi:hypothetical protein